MPASQEQPTASGVEILGATKSFGAVQALKAVDFSAAPGEVVGLVGDNGAGKSTLAKILSGALRPDAGDYRIEGAQVQISGVRDARAFGIEMLYQDLALCDDLDVAENFYAGREPTRFGLLRRRWMQRHAVHELDQLGIHLKSTEYPTRVLSGGQRQSLAIARAVAYSNRLLILDEPTAALGVSQSRAVLDLIRQVRARGISVVLISHRMNDILAVCDRVVVLFEGHRVAELDAGRTTIEEIVNFIVTDPRAA
ncbi:MAG TPA: ATP-binding cassette domain-containing protein [Gaiellaceae bacterium]|jgi:simple sugar transport system ATP-binding protein